MQKDEILQRLESLNHSLESKNTLSLGLQSDVSKLQILVEQAETDVEDESAQIKKLHIQVQERRAETALEQRAKTALEGKLQTLQFDFSISVGENSLKANMPCNIR